MIAQVRTVLFAVIFYGFSVPIILLAPVAALFGRRSVQRYAVVWTMFHRWCARVILGIRVRIVGRPSDTPVLYASKHQAMFETLEYALILNGPAIVLKRELTRIPVWGWSARQYGTIAIDRESSAGALRAMMRQAKVAKAQGRSILIFPEGTRVAPGETPPLRAGFAGLYRMLAMPVVPIAVDSGVVWPRRGAKRPGVITLQFGEPIPPGLARDEIEARVHEEINMLERR